MSYALILGASSDIALACARELAHRKFNLYLAGRNVESLKRAADDLAIRYSVDVKPVSFDALNFSNHSQVFKSLQPTPVLTICVFGLLGDQAVSEKNWAECERVIHSNYTGAVSIVNVVANHYEEQGAGTIVGISSVAGERGRQSNYIYGSAKAGFTAYLSGLRNRLAKKGVHVLTVKPGFVNTRMTEGLKLPKPLTAQPDQVARSVVKAIESKRNVIYTLWMWRWIMLIIRNIPEGIFKKLKL